MQQKPKLPDQTWSITKEEKKKIVDLGRELTKFIFDYAKKSDGKFHVKIAVGACQYFTDLQRQKAELVGEDLIASQDALERFQLGNMINEPFTEEDIVVPTKEELIAQKKAELAALESAPVTDPAPVDPEAPIGDVDVDDASITPESKPVQIDAAAPAPEVAQ